jgi:hypothetical protein
VEGYLRQDGVFIMRLVEQNASTFAVTVFLGSLWEAFRTRTKTSADEDGDGQEPLEQSDALF